MRKIVVATFLFIIIVTCIVVKANALSVSLTSPASLSRYYFIAISSSTYTFSGTISGGMADSIQFRYYGRIGSSNTLGYSVVSTIYNPSTSYSYNILVPHSVFKNAPYISGSPHWPFFCAVAVQDGNQYSSSMNYHAIVYGYDTSFYTTTSPYFYYTSSSYNSFRGGATGAYTGYPYTYNCIAYAAGEYDEWCGYSSPVDVDNYLVGKGYAETSRTNYPTIVLYTDPVYHTTVWHAARVVSWSSGAPSTIISKWGGYELIYSQVEDAFAPSTYGDPTTYYK